MSYTTFRDAYLTEAENRLASVNVSTASTNDLLIAGHARSRSLIVVTGNLREFARVEGLRCEDWPAGPAGPYLT